MGMAEWPEDQREIVLHGRRIIELSPTRVRMYHLGYGGYYDQDATFEEACLHWLLCYREASREDFNFQEVTYQQNFKTIMEKKLLKKDGLDLLTNKEV